LQRVQRGVLGLEIIDVRLDREWCTASTFDDFRCGELTAVAINIFAQPAVQSAELPLRHLIGNGRMCLERSAIELCGENVAECITLECAADDAVIPMHILKHAIAIVRRDNTKIM